MTRAGYYIGVEATHGQHFTGDVELSVTIRREEHLLT